MGIRGDEAKLHPIVRVLARSIIYCTRFFVHHRTRESRWTFLATVFGTWLLAVDYFLGGSLMSVGWWISLALVIGMFSVLIVMLKYYHGVSPDKNESDKKTDEMLSILRDIRDSVKREGKDE